MKYKCKYMVGGFLIVITTTILYLIAYGFFGNSLALPTTYAGADEFSLMSELKAEATSGSVVDIDDLGAPYGTQRYGAINYYLFNDTHYIGALFYKITGNVFMAINLLVITFVALNGLSSYIVMLALKIKYEFAVMSGIAYGLLSYVFYRGISHAMLSAYYVAPLAILICMWLLQDKDFYVVKKGFFKNKKNIAAIIITLIFANNGIGYYPFFSCFFIIGTSIYLSLSRKKIKELFRSILVIVNIFVWILITCIPYFINKLMYGSNAFLSQHSQYEGEIYALKITRLLIPSHTTGISILDSFTTSYNNNTPLQTEITEFMGLLAIIGFVILFIVLLSGNAVKKEELRLLSIMNVFAILLACIGGFGSIFNILIFDQVRCYNRISVYIAFICLLGFGYVYSIYRDKLNKYICIGILFVLTLVSLFLQIPRITVSQEDIDTYNSDKNFVEEIESEMEAGSMIYQLPYAGYPETGKTETGMFADRSFSGFLYSKSLKWTYGAYKGSQTDTWWKNTSSLEVNEMINDIIVMGFTGIYIDSRGYTETDLNKLLDEIHQITDVEYSVSEDGNMYFFNITDYEIKVKESLSEEQWNDLYNESNKLSESVNNE